MRHPDPAHAEIGRARRRGKSGCRGRMRLGDGPAGFGARRGQQAPHGQRIQLALGILARQGECPGIGMNDEAREAVALGESGHLRLQGRRLQADRTQLVEIEPDRRHRAGHPPQCLVERAGHRVLAELEMHGYPGVLPGERE